jgi:nucleoside-diphosphate-sugar epimerase
MKKILVTGSLGYIGTVLTGYLEKFGYDVVGYDVGFFKDATLYRPKEVETKICDARSITERELKDIDVVVHLAGISNDPVGKLNPALVYDPTRAYSLEIAMLCKKMNIKFIFASSCSVYGLGAEEYLSELSATYPQTFYSLNKLQIEEDLKSIADKNFSPIALRFATIFGPSPRIRFDVVINMFVGMAVSKGSIILNSNGKSWRPNLHILDACQAIKHAIDFDHKTSDLLVLNVGMNENNLQILEIAKRIQKNIAGCKLEFLSESAELDKEGLVRDRKVKNGTDNRTYKVSFDKIKKMFPDFECKFTIEQGIEDMIAKLEGLALTEDQFKSRRFYRLQHLEDLYEAGRISDELAWVYQPKFI